VVELFITVLNAKPISATCLQKTDRYSILLSN